MVDPEFASLGLSPGPFIRDPTDGLGESSSLSYLGLHVLEREGPTGIAQVDFAATSRIFAPPMRSGRAIRPYPPLRFAQMGKPASDVLFGRSRRDLTYPTGRRWYRLRWGRRLPQALVSGTFE